MKITLLAPKDFIPSYIKEGIHEYTKRLSRYCQLNLLEYTSIHESLQLLDDKCYILWVSEKFDTLTSESLASTIETLGIGGISSIAFCLIDKPIDISADLNADLNVDSNALAEAEPRFLKQFSLSKMSLSHETALLLMHEQLYRSYRIIHGEPYHK